MPAAEQVLHDKLMLVCLFILSLLRDSTKMNGWLIKCHSVVLWKHQWCHSMTIYVSTHSYLKEEEGSVWRVERAEERKRE